MARNPRHARLLDEEDAHAREPFRREPIHTSSAVRISAVMAGGGMLVHRPGRDPLMEKVGNTCLDNYGQPITQRTGGATVVKAEPSDRVLKLRADMGGASPDGRIKLASW